MYELKVEGMTCGGCVRSVTKSIHGIDSNAKVDVDLKSKKVRVDTDADLQVVASAIVDAGYPVTETHAV